MAMREWLLIGIVDVLGQYTNKKGEQRCSQIITEGSTK